MKRGIKKILGFVSASVLSLASIFSLLFVTIKNNRDLSLQNALETTETSILGGGEANSL